MDDNHESVPFHDFCLKSIWHHSDRVALLDHEEPTRRYTFRDVFALSHAVATALHNFGIGKGDKVASVMRNCIEYPLVYFGVSLRGGVLSGANPECSPADLAYHLKDCGATFVFVHEEALVAVREAIALCPKQIKIIFCVGTTYDVDLLENEVYFTELLAVPPDFGLEKVEINPRKDLAYLPYSSGTTGLPKGVMLTHHGLHKQATMVAEGIMEVFNIIDRDLLTFASTPVLGLTPYYHVMGFTQLLDNLRSGATHIPVPKFAPVTFLTLIQQYKIMMLNIPPTLLNFLTKSPLTRNYDLTSLALVSSGAAPWGKKAMLEFVARYPHVSCIITGYGMTETSSAVTVTPPKAISAMKFGSVGRVVAGYEVKLVDPDTGLLVGPNQEGEICVKSDMLMKGYFNKDDATRTTIDGDGYLHTGDIGYYDNDGDFFITDRIKELIKVKGFQVAPAELEDLLLSHPAVADTAVVGRHSQTNTDEELPTAFVTLKEGFTGSQQLVEQICHFVEEKVVKYKRLTGGVHFVAEIPKSPTGKILRRLLRNQFCTAATSKL